MLLNKKNPTKVLVTGGAGFIGSHLVNCLMEMGCLVRVVDNFSSGTLENIKLWIENPRFEFVQGDLKNPAIAKETVKTVETIFHLAANPEVQIKKVSPQVHFRENLLLTFNVLEAMRKSKSAKKIVFFSSSTVYGEPKYFPTCEDYGPLLPISVYGASKLGCESLISSYCYSFGLRGLILRLANIVGGRSRHGVIPDFVRKLHQNPKELEILGNGSQNKSYLHINDLIDAVNVVYESFLRRGNIAEIFNLGSFDQVDVSRIAEIITEEMGLQSTKFRFTGGVDAGRGWIGDVKVMLLSVEKLHRLGWKPSLNSEEAVKLCCRELLGSMKASAHMHARAT